jgi:chromate reductase
VGVDEPVRILLVSGSTRGRSTNTAALLSAAQVAPDGVIATLFEGLSDLPAFNPDDEHVPHPAVDHLRRELVGADAVLFCTPEYAGSLPGSFKNLLAGPGGGGELYGTPGAWVTVAAAGRGRGAEESLGVVLRYVGAEIIGPACVRLPVPRQALDPEGAVIDDAVRSRLAEIVATMVRHIAPRSAG